MAVFIALFIYFNDRSICTSAAPQYLSLNAENQHSPDINFTAIKLDVEASIDVFFSLVCYFFFSFFSSQRQILPFSLVRFHGDN